jgi:Cu2+-containing amine oxidase
MDMFNLLLHKISSKAKKGSVLPMLFRKNILFFFAKNDEEKIELKKKIASLEMNMEELKKAVLEMDKKSSQEMKVKSEEPPIIIEKINIEKIILDKYELNNNFGQLGIKELKGKLNIGATYGSDFTPLSKDEENAERTGKEKVNSPRKDEKGGPKVNIQTKAEE